MNVLPMVIKMLKLALRRRNPQNLREESTPELLHTEMKKKEQEPEPEMNLKRKHLLKQIWVILMMMILLAELDKM
jgi:hypothetical protein